MKTMMKAMLAATCLAMGMTTATYAEEFTQGGGFSSGAGSGDVYFLECSGVGNICAKVIDAGPFFDNTFGVFLLCFDNGKDAVDVAQPGKQTKNICVKNCTNAAIVPFCDEDSDHCDDSYLAEIKCKGDVQSFEQITDE